MSLLAPDASLGSRKVAEEFSLRVICHNIRYATNNVENGEELWPVRCPRLCAELIYTANVPSTFICLQEVLSQQLRDVQSALNRAYSPPGMWLSIGVGREDGQEAGEFSPIFFNTSHWQLLSHKTSWLSETPERPSKGWDAACIRIVTVGVFQHISTGKGVVVMNTHLDDQGAIARAESAKILLSLVHEHQTLWRTQGDVPVLLAGDFNSSPDGEAYKIMTAPSSGMADLSQSISQRDRYGHRMTYTSFDSSADASLIDFIFGSATLANGVASNAILENRFDDGVYLSDHRAVVVDLCLSM